MENEMLDKQFELESDEWIEMLDSERDEQVQNHINDILDEAVRWGMREEVRRSAEEYSNVDVMTAYSLAFNDWIK